MANILDKYGIKEVCDITFYEIDSTTGKPGVPVLYIDTAKVSTVENTAESTDATGGKGNVPLITWDYGREVTMTLEDALFSAKSLGVMFGGKPGAPVGEAITKVLAFTALATTNDATSAGAPTTWTGPNGAQFEITDPTYFDAETQTEAEAFVEGKAYFVKFDVVVKDSMTIDITADRFPGTYYVTGDTYARSEKTGNDEFFQLIIPKAKVLSEDVSLTMEAEGDPSTFSMNLKILRNQEANQRGMIQLVKYDVEGGAASDYAAHIWSYDYSESESGQ